MSSTDKMMKIAPAPKARMWWVAGLFFPRGCFPITAITVALVEPLASWAWRYVPSEFADGGHQYRAVAFNHVNAPVHGQFLSK